MLKFKLGEKYSYDSIFSAENQVVTVVGRTEKVVLLSHGIDEVTGEEMITTHDIIISEESEENMEYLLVEKYQDEENHLQADDIYDPVQFGDVTVEYFKGVIRN